MNNTGVINGFNTRFKKGHTLSNESRLKLSSSLKALGLNGVKSASWKGNNITYIGIHAWLKRTFGKATKCENPDCVYPRKGFDGRIMLAPKGFAWAKIEGLKYERKRENFFQLCNSCHHKYDRTGEKSWETRLKQQII